MLTQLTDTYPPSDKQRLEVFLDEPYVYGGSVSSKMVVLWKIKKLDGKTFGPPATVQLPASEAIERTVRDMIEEAISEGAWDS